MKRRIVLTMLLGALAVMFASTGAWAYTAPSKYIITDDGGGDCSSIGSWDSGSKTCTLTQDVDASTSYYAPIEVASDDIILDGNGYNVSGGVQACVWLSQQYQNDVTVKNLDFDYCWTAIRATAFSNGITIENNKMYSTVYYGISAPSALFNSVISNNDITTNYVGISLSGPNVSTNIVISDNKVKSVANSLALALTSVHNSTIKNNTFEGDYGAVYAYNCNSSIFSNNLVENSPKGFYVDRTSYATFRLNSIENNDVGFYLKGVSTYNDIYNNNFINNDTDVDYETLGTGNAFNKPSPDGGNYWDKFDTPAEGCDDDPADGFCDDAYTPVTGVTDNLPLTNSVAYTWLFDTLGDTGGASATNGPGDNIAFMGSEIGVAWTNTVGSDTQILFINSTDNGDSWQNITEIAKQSYYTSDGASIAAGSYDDETVFHFAYSGTSGFGDVFYDNSNGDGEIEVTLGEAIAATMYSRSIVADDSGNAYIAFWGYDDRVDYNRIFVATLITNSTTGEVDPDLSSTEAVADCTGCWGEPDIALDSSGNPHVIWYDYVSAQWKHKLTSWNGTSWTTETIRDADTHDYWATLAISSSDEICVSWWNDNDEEIKVSCEGDSWTERTVQSSVSEVVYRPGIVFDSNGDLRVVWADANGVYYKKGDTSGHWGIKEQVASANAPDDPSIALDANDKAHIVYKDNNGNVLRHAQQVGY